jgi:glutaredoxin
MMKTKAIFYHAGCPVCVAAEHSVVNALDPSRYTVELVHLGTNKSRVKEAESAGVKSLPALVMDGVPFHINFGASIDAVK